MIAINPATGRNRVSFETLPNEILINIFSRFHGHVAELRKLRLTCRTFDLVLGHHRLIILRNLLSGRSTTELLILGNPYRSMGVSIRWLGHAERMNAIIDDTLFHLERLAAFEDERYIFMPGTTNRDPCHARRILRTVLLAAYIISIQGDHQAKISFIMQRAPTLLITLAAHMNGLVAFLLHNGYVFIEGLDTEMKWSDDTGSPFPVAFLGMHRVLLEGTRIFGPWLLLRLLSAKRKFSNCEQFVKCMFDLYEAKEPGRHRLYGNMIIVPSDVCEALSYRIRRSLSNPLAWRDPLGITFLGSINLARWSGAIPNEHKWKKLMERCYLMQKLKGNIVADALNKAWQG